MTAETGIVAGKRVSRISSPRRSSWSRKLTIRCCGKQGGVPKDDEEAVNRLRLAAGEGNAVAQNDLGKGYAQGQGLPRDDAAAVEWFRLAAEQGNAAAQNNLGIMYASGRGVPKDDAEAVKWYRQAADQGNADNYRFFFSIFVVTIVVGALVVIALVVRRVVLSRRHPIVPTTNALAIRSPVEQAASEARLQVFVSYSRLDGGTVDRVVHEIEQAGCLVWIDRGTLNGIQRYAAPIVGAIKSSQVVALMCSRKAFQPDHVIREIYVAGDHKKPFLLFQLDSCEFPDEILYFVSGFPRVPVDSIRPGQVRSEIVRLMAS